MSTTTKSQILALLKRNGGHSVAELAESLGLASVTVRQHLTRLERDGMVASERRAGPGGRPHYAFRLTVKGHAAAFPRRSDRVVELLVREVGRLEGSEIEGLTAAGKTQLVLGRLASHLAEEYGPLLKGWSLQERVAFVTELMHSEGGFAECERTERGYEIRDFNCLFHRLLGNDGAGAACEWHRTFLSRMLGAEVRVSPCPDPEAECCRYIVEERQAIPATAGASGEV